MQKYLGHKKKGNCKIHGILVILGTILVIFICSRNLCSAFINSNSSDKKSCNPPRHTSEDSFLTQNDGTETQPDTSRSLESQSVESEQMETHSKSEQKEAESASGSSKFEQKEAESVSGSSKSEQKETESDSEATFPELTPEEKLQEIRANESLYPEKILHMLDKNMETLDFVYHYPEKKDHIYTYHLDDEDMDYDRIPLLIQWDERWGYGNYGDDVIATNGCGPTCMAMVIAGLNQDKNITPYKMAALSERKGYLTDDGSTSWSYIADGGLDYGVQGHAIYLDEELIKDTLQSGNPIICSVRPGDFTDNGHYIVLTDYMAGMIKVNDPYSYANSEKLWTFEQLQPQIKNLWEMKKIDENQD